jgi:hypothetical protein
VLFNTLILAGKAMPPFGVTVISVLSLLSTHLPREVLPFWSISVVVPSALYLTLFFAISNEELALPTRHTRSADAVE